MPGREKVKLRAPRSNPLGDDIHASRFARNKKDNDDANGNSHGTKKSKANEANDGHFLIPTRTTQRILRTARDELERIQEEEISSRANTSEDAHDVTFDASRESHRHAKQTNETLTSELDDAVNENDIDVGLQKLLSVDVARTAEFEKSNGNDEEECLDEAMAEEDVMTTNKSHHQHYSDNNAEEKDENENEDEDDNTINELEYDETESVASDEPFNTDNMDENDNLFDIDDEEARLLQKFQPASKAQSRNLADMIMEKIREKEVDVRADAKSNSDHENSHDTSLGVATSTAEAKNLMLPTKHKLRDQASLIRSEEENDVNPVIDNRVARVYTAIGSVMKKYTSGKVPKAFKILPNVENWEQLIMLTKPDQWSPHATYQATRIFAANLNERMAQRFYAAILLPIVHEQLREEHKLHPALYNAVRKALFKPIAFFKGFLLPLVSDEECTLREAVVIASILQRCHLPPVPTAVTMVKITELPFSAVCCVFLRVLIDKKMTLPYQAIDALVMYFYRFTRTHDKEEKLPVLWHQTLLSFMQRYKLDLTPGQLQMLSEVCTMHFHYLITPEIRREIQVAVKSQSSANKAAGGSTLGKAHDFATSRVK